MIRTKIVLQARHQILQIHTSQWLPKLLDPFLREVAEKCIGMCFSFSHLSNEN